MNKREQVPIIGSVIAGGFYAGAIRINGQAFALIVAPQTDGDHAPAIWIDDYKEVPGAKSYFDGAANTAAMVEAGSALAKWAQALSIGGFTDWYLPAQDELEICYRNIKPTAGQNSQYARAGININAIEPTAPYSLRAPVQTPAIAFQEGGAEAFDAKWYWSSTQRAAGSDYAWCQNFDYGLQGYYGGTYTKLRARAVRRVAI